MFDPAVIRNRVRSALELAGSEPWLIGYDINGIQQLVTASSRPVAMRGASQAIKAFDAKCASNKTSIFAGGGRGVELASSAQAARARMSELVAEFRRETSGGVLVADAVPFQPTSQSASIAWLKRRLENAKDSAPRQEDELAHAKADQCQDCDAQLARHQVDSGDPPRRVCARCSLLIGVGRKAGETRQSLLELAGNRRIAAISADGNNLGAFFASLASLEELAAASEAVAEIFRRAHQAALQRISKLPTLSPVTGGDDIRLFVSPAGVLPYVETLIREVEGLAQQAGRLGDLISPERAQAFAQLGVGVGAVVAGDHYPASRLMAYAHDLERSAKSICPPTAPAAAASPLAACRSAFDFAILTTESASAHDRPAPCSMDPVSWQRTLQSARALRKVPTSQRAVLAERGRLSGEELSNWLCYQVARSPDWRLWLEASGVSWSDRDQVLALARSTRVDLLDLLPAEAP